MATPRRNLPPQSDPWARNIEQRLSSTERKTAKALSDNTITLQSVNATLNQLSRQVQDLAETTNQLQAQQAELQAQQEYMASLVSRSAATGYWYTSWHDTGNPSGEWYWQAGPSLTMAIPTGRARIYLRSDSVQVTRNEANGSVNAGITYGVSNGVMAPGINYMQLGLTIAGVSTSLSSGLTRFGTIDAPPGTYTFTGYYGIRAWGPTDVDGQTASFDDLALVVEVVNPN